MNQQTGAQVACPGRRKLIGVAFLFFLQKDRVTEHSLAPGQGAAPPVPASVAVVTAGAVRPLSPRPPARCGSGGSPRDVCARGWRASSGCGPTR